MCCASAPARRRSVVVILAALLTLVALSASALEQPAPPTAIVPTRDPFSLNAYDATQALWMIRRAGLLQSWSPGGSRSNIAVREVRAVLVEIDRDAPTAALRRRYDLLLNGEPLDWRTTYIEYGGRMVNLQLLFTYRNQYPPADLPYRISEEQTP